MGVDDFIETNWGRGYMVIDHRADAGAEPVLRNLAHYSAAVDSRSSRTSNTVSRHQQRRNQERNAANTLGAERLVWGPEASIRRRRFAMSGKLKDILRSVLNSIS
jgi:hypothetical protein